MCAHIISKPTVSIDEAILNELETSIHEAGQVVVHCIHQNMSDFPALIRIWPTTYLFDQHSDHCSDLVLAENISYYPEWTPVGRGHKYFSLIFSGLPEDCTVFDLIEDCKGGFHPFQVKNIRRNDTDVYFVQV